ncbi:MAG: histidine kinase, partial [Deltaproteobacteria bacterium]|nr:histidine kinase [Deltaproteobacteria bacterium]
MKRKFKKKVFPLISPLLLAGVLLILLPIVTLMTLDRLDRQKEFFTQRLIEKGISLIRTFEAGTRTGMFTMRWGANR